MKFYNLECELSLLHWDPEAFFHPSTSLSALWRRALTWGSPPCTARCWLLRSGANIHCRTWCAPSELSWGDLLGHFHPPHWATALEETRNCHTGVPRYQHNPGMRRYKLCCSCSMTILMPSQGGLGLLAGVIGHRALCCHADVCFLLHECIWGCDRML